MKSERQQIYNQIIDLITHLILTKPKPLEVLLAKHGIVFKGKPTQKELIFEMVELLKSNQPEFKKNLEALLIKHLQYKGKEMLALERSNFYSYNDSDYDEFWGKIAKVGLGLVGKLFKGKRRRRSRGGGNAAAVAASQAAAARRRADAQAARMRRDFEQKLLAMKMAESKRRREEAERRRREEAERRRREAQAKQEAEAARKKQTQNMVIAGGGIALLAVVGIFMAKSNSKPMYPYMPTQVQPVTGR